MSSVNNMSTVALISLTEALIRAGERVYRERKAAEETQQANERLAAIFGINVDIEPGFTFELQGFELQNLPVGAGLD
jgi:hypothetical protein